MILISIEVDGQPARRVMVHRLPCRIGRRADNEVVLDSWRVARVHARILRMERGLRLVDEGTLSGTWVNGERVVEFGPLESSDEITISGFCLKVIATDAKPEVFPAAGGLQDAGADVVLPAGDAGIPRIESLSRFQQAEGLVDHAAGRAGSRTMAGAGIRPEPGGMAVNHATSVVAPSALDPSDPLPARREDFVDAADPLAWRVLLHQRLLQTIDLRRLDIRQLSGEQLRADARALMETILAQEIRLPEGLDSRSLIDETLDEVVGLGPLERLMADPSVSEIMVNCADEIFVERHGRLEPTCLRFSSEAAVRAVIERIVAPIGRRIDESSPMVDARLQDGSRVNAIIPPLAIKGSALTIRRFGQQALRPDDLIRLDSASVPMVEFLRQCIVLRRNLVIAGGTGSGKTTLLNVLANFITPHERLVTIEDAAELSLGHANVVRLEARSANSEGRGQVAIRELVRNALRMRPDRIIVGECRGGEALDMLQAMNTGHDGSLTTIHANSPRDAVSRLETMVLMAGMDLPLLAIREQIASAVEVIVHQARGADGSRRIVEIAEVTGTEGSRVLMQPIFRHRQGRFEHCGNMPQFYERLGLATDSFLSSTGQLPEAGR